MPKRRTSRYATSEPSSSLTTARRCGSSGSDPVGSAQQAPRHPEVDQENTTALEPNNQILAAPLDRRDALAFQLGRHLGRLVRAHEARVVDPHLLEAAPDERRLELPADALDLRQLRHPPRLRRHDGLPGNPARRRLAAEPGVHGGADVRELALVDLSGCVPSLDVGEQQRVLAGVVRRRRRRVAAVVRRDDQQVSRPERVEQVGTAGSRSPAGSGGS